VVRQLLHIGSAGNLRTRPTFSLTVSIDDHLGATQWLRSYASMCRTPPCCFKEMESVLGLFPHSLVPVFLLDGMLRTRLLMSFVLELEN